MTLSLSLLLALTPTPTPRAADGIHTATADVRTCAFVGDDVLAGTGGGLVVVTGRHEVGDVVTRLHGLPGTQVDAIAPVVGAPTAWVGTEGGLARVRHDGTRIEVERAIAGPAVRAVAVAEDEVWVGTLDAGVKRLQGDRLVDVPLPADVREGQRRIHDLVRHDGTWWVATADGLLTGDASGLAARTLPGLDGELVWSLRAGADDALWLGTLAGLHRHDGTRTRKVSDVDARAIAIDGTEVEVAAMGEGVRRFGARGRDDGLDATPGAIVHGIARDGKRRCVATGEGLWLSEGAHGRRWLAGGLPSRDVSAMAWDTHENRLWVGTFDAGLAAYDDAAWSRVARDVDVDPQVNAIALQRVDDRTVAWVGTARGLARIDGDRTRTWSFKEGLPHHHVQALHVRDDGDVVVGTTTGFVLVRDDEVIADVYRKRPRRWAVWSITEDDEGTLWAGTTQGLIRYPVDGAWTRFSMLDGVLPDNWVTSVVVDGEHLWVGTYAGGVARVRVDGDALVEPEHFGGGRINPAGLSLEGDRLWVSTMGGLRELSATDGTWREHPDATPGHDVKGVVLAGHHRWVASRRGLRRH